MGWMMTLLGGCITGESLYPKGCEMMGFMSCQWEVFEPVTQPWSCDVFISGSDEDVGVHLIILPNDAKNRITNRLDDN